MFDTVPVPADGSECAQEAVGYAEDRAGRFDARVHALSVVDTMAMGVDVRSHAVLDALDESARSAIARIEERASTASVSAVETEILSGGPYRAIRSYVEEHDVDDCDRACYPPVNASSVASVTPDRE